MFRSYIILGLRQLSEFSLETTSPSWGLLLCGRAEPILWELAVMSQTCFLMRDKGERGGLVQLFPVMWSDGSCWCYWLGSVRFAGTWQHPCLSSILHTLNWLIWEYTNARITKKKWRIKWVRRRIPSQGRVSNAQNRHSQLASSGTACYDARRTNSVMCGSFLGNISWEEVSTRLLRGVSTASRSQQKEKGERAGKGLKREEPGKGKKDSKKKPFLAS